MKTIGFFAGVVIGTIAVYNFALTAVERTAFQLFRWGLENDVQVFDGDTIANSSTFWKMAGGAIVGGWIGSRCGGGGNKSGTEK